MPELKKEQLYIIIGVIFILLIGCMYGIYGGGRIVTKSSPSFAQGASEGKPSSDLGVLTGKSSSPDDVPKTRLNKYIYVHVSGAVNRGGLYKLSQGDRLYDLLKLAGLSSDADINDVNLAEGVTDGERIVIPAKRSSNVLGGAESEKKPAETSGKININSADEKELDGLPGVGPVMAKKIAAYRAEHGRFRSAEDLKNVPGISDKKFQAMSKSITLY